MTKTIKIKYQGAKTEVTLRPCHHCGKIPTAKDAMRAVKHARDTSRTCAVCGGRPPLYPKHDLYHSVDCSGKGGFILCGTGIVDPDWDPQWLSVYTGGPSGFVDAHFHADCLKKVAPGVTIQKR